jgi:chromosome partitioning protein
MRQKVLLVDLEADLNASISLGVRPASARRPSIAEVLMREVRPADAIRPVAHTPNLFLLTGSPELVRIDSSLRNVREPERRLADVIKPLVPQFDTIILDSPSGYSLLARSVPLVADQLVVPTRAEYLSLESVAHFLSWYRDYHDDHKPIARLCGILLTMVDYRRDATREIIDIIRLHNRRGVFSTEVPLDPRVAEAPSHGVPVVAYASASRGSRAYRHVAAELITRTRHRRTR